MYIFLQSHLTQEWPKYIDQIVQGINAIPLKRLGFLAPKDIINEASSVIVDENLKKHNLHIPTEPTYKKQAENQKLYKKEATKNEKLIDRGDYVYLKQKEESFGKSFDIQESTQIALNKMLLLDPKFGNNWRK